MKETRQPVPAALYARVSSDRQDVDLSVAAQLRALRDFAERNGYVVAREFVDEAESGRVADRPQFRRMLDEASQPNAPFQEILVWKFSRFTRKREHAVAFKSMLRRRGIRVTSITEHADDTPTGKLMEAIIESVDEFYSENLAQEVTRGMRESAARGFFLGSRAPYGYKRVKVQDGGKERPTLEIDPATAPIVKEMFERSARGQGLKEICQDLHDRGITKNGKRWQKNMLHYVLTNEAYTGMAVWGKTAKDGRTPDPVRVADAWPAIVSRELYESVQAGLRARAPKIQSPARVGSKFLLSGLLRCGVCGKPYTGQSAKSGQFAYYVCNRLLREGAGACDGRYLNAGRMEDQVVAKIMQRILNEETITELVQLVAEEVDALAEERASDLALVESDLDDVRRRLEKLYDAIENSELTYEALSPRILKLRQQEDQLAAAMDDAVRQLEQRRADLPSTPEIKRYVAEFREFLEAGTIPERKALIRNFVQGVKVDGDEVSIRYTIPMPFDGATQDRESVLDFVQSGPPDSTIGKNRRRKRPCSVRSPGATASVQERVVAQHVVDRNPRAALVVIVPEAEPLVGSFRARHDPIAALGLPAHITINFPFIPGVDPTTDTLDRLRKTFAEAQPFSFTLDQIGRFPNVVYLAPAPSAPFVQLAEQIAQEFPESPPYEGQFEDITPHLTFAYSNDNELLASVEQAFSNAASSHLPLHAEADQVWLMDDTSGQWEKRASFSLGAADGSRSGP